MLVLAGPLAAPAQASNPPLRLCADPANLPFSSSAPESARAGAPGLHLEIGEAVAAALGRPFEAVWSLTYFGKRNLRTTMLAGQCDMAVGLPATEDFMGPAVIYSKPIGTIGYALVRPKGMPVDGLGALRGKRVAVQFASPPQSLLATHDEITSVTVMDPEEGMRKLAEGAVDAAMLWGPSAGYVNRTQFADRFEVTPIDAPQMQFPTAIGFAKKERALRDQVDAVLPALAPRIRELETKYAAPAGSAVRLADASTAPSALSAAAPATAAAAAPAANAVANAGGGNVANGHQLFNGTCAHCHGPDAVVADRKINLRLLRQKYGGEMENVFLTTVTNGRPAKGMPNWSQVFSRDDFADILAYLKTLQQN